MTNEYTAALAALEAPPDEIQHLLVAMAASSRGIDKEDEFGLTISMRAAAHGRLDVIKAARTTARRRSRKRNPQTRANILHYAAQQPKRGAKIIGWVTTEEQDSDDLLKERIYAGREEGPGIRNGTGATVTRWPSRPYSTRTWRWSRSCSTSKRVTRSLSETSDAWLETTRLGIEHGGGYRYLDLLMSKVHPNLTTDDPLNTEKEE